MSQYNQAPYQRPRNSKATAALVCGIISLVLVWFGYSAIGSVILGIVAIVCSVGARKEMGGQSTGMATAGLVLGVIGIILGSITFVACVICAGALGAMGAFSEFL